LTVREDLSYGISVAGGAAVGALSWFLNSPLLGVVTGVLLGTGLALLTQSRTQKRAWKRELGLRNIDLIYGPLYREITTNLAKGAPSARTSFEQLEDGKWKTIKADYLYDFIPAGPKEQFGEYYGLVEKYNPLIQRVLTQVQNTIHREASTFYQLDVQEVQYGARVSGSGVLLPVVIRDLVLFGGHPSDYLRSMYRDVSFDRFLVTVTWADPSQGMAQKQVHLESPEDLKGFDEFFENVRKTVGGLEVVVEIKRILGQLNFLGQEVQGKALQLIREPWAL
jgi:hypothetical protein